jgi:predicted nuclease with RNAse H fold
MRRHDVYIGIDLAADPHRCTGFVAIDSSKLAIVEARCLGDDVEIIERVKFYQNSIVAIDAPFGFGDGFMRNVDRKMISLGYRVFPPGFSHMKNLTMRAQNLVKEFKSLGRVVIETHPKSVLKSSNCKTVDELAEKLSVKELELIPRNNKHIIDALLAAIASLCYDMGCYLVIEDVDGSIWLVKKLC